MTELARTGNQKRQERRHQASARAVDAVARERDAALGACLLAQEALLMAVGFGLSPEARRRAGDAIEAALCAVGGVLRQAPSLETETGARS